MKNFASNYFNPAFSHVYVEKKAMNRTRTKRILEKFPNAVIVEIEHYKDVFCRSGQDSTLQRKAQSLILAVKEGELLYKGAPVCQNFGNEYFYYTSCMMNCVYDCEYCYLKGMYPSGHVVVFVNIEDIFEQAEKILKKHSLYLCVSYDTDLMAMEYMTGYTKAWTDFAGEHPELTVEIRTKCANELFFEKQKPLPNVVYAFTVSPQTVIEQWEHKTPSLSRRILCAKNAVERGFGVRLCFDPVIYCAEWKKEYAAMLDEIVQNIDMKKLVDVSVGTFRVSQDYLKRMRKNNPYSAVVQFPYENDRGVYHYPGELQEEMEQYMTGKLEQQIGRKKIFCWTDEKI